LESIIRIQASLIADLRAKVDQLDADLQRAVRVNSRRIDAFNLTSSAPGNGVRSTQELLRIALGKERRASRFCWNVAANSGGRHASSTGSRRRSAPP
jgi:hypothetical protein